MLLGLRPGKSRYRINLPQAKASIFNSLNRPGPPGKDSYACIAKSIEDESGFLSNSANACKRWIGSDEVNRSASDWDVPVGEAASSPDINPSPKERS